MSANVQCEKTVRASGGKDVSLGQSLRKHGMTVVDFRAICEVIGVDALRYVLQCASKGQEGDIAEPYAVVEYEKYAKLHHAIRGLYGPASHGILNRIGRLTFRHFVEEQAGQMAAINIALRLMPLRARKIFILKVIAHSLSESNHHETVYLQEDNGLLHLVDMNSPACHGVLAGEPVCWHTVGFIEEALQWATSQEFRVEEISCQAQGMPVCVFAIAKEPNQPLHLTWR